MTHVLLSCPGGMMQGKQSARCGLADKASVRQQAHLWCSPADRLGCLPHHAFSDMKGWLSWHPQQYAARSSMGRCSERAAAGRARRSTCRACIETRCVVEGCMLLR